MENEMFYVKSILDSASLKEKYLRDKFNLVEIDGSIISSPDDIFKIFRDKLRFPSYFGENWNAFYDCITDLMWLQSKQTVILIENLDELIRLEFFDTLIHCLIDAKRWWRKNDNDFDLVVFLNVKSDSNSLAKLKKIEKRLINLHNKKDE